jgi:hypothetical protein
MTEKHCEHCGVGFQPKRADARFHSARCRVAHFRANRGLSVTETLHEPVTEPLSVTETGGRRATNLDRAKRYLRAMGVDLND